MLALTVILLLEFLNELDSNNSKDSQSELRMYLMIGDI